MRKLFRALAMASFVAGLPAAEIAQAQPRAEGQAQQARAFPNLTTIYRIAGVTDNGGATNVGVATVVHCTNFKASTAQVQFVVRGWDGAVLANPAFNIPARATFTASTHATFLFDESGFLLTTATVIRQGSMIIKATTPKVHCSAVVVDAGVDSDENLVPTFAVALSLTRLNQEKGAQE